MAEPTLNQPAFFRQLVSSVLSTDNLSALRSYETSRAGQYHLLPRLKVRGLEPHWSHTGATLEPQCHSDVEICCHMLPSHGMLASRQLRLNHFADVRRWLRDEERWNEWQNLDVRLGAREAWVQREPGEIRRACQAHLFRYSGCKATIRTSLCLTTMVTKRTCPARMAVLL